MVDSAVTSTRPLGGQLPSSDEPFDAIGPADDRVFVGPKAFSGCWRHARITPYGVKPAVVAELRS
jgi:hypothetical protein